MSKRRLATFFHPQFSDGGVERTNIYQAKGLIERGYQVEFLTTFAMDHFRREVSESGIRLIELGGRHTALTIPKLIRYLVAASRRYEQVYFISCQYYVNVVTMFAAMLLRRFLKNIKFINSERNHFDEFAFRGDAKSKLILFLVRRLYKFADLIIANSDETARDLSKLIRRPVHRVYNPTINERIDALSKDPVEESWFIDDARPCVIAIGRLSLQKNFGLLVDAFRLVRDRLDMRLVILGEGPLRKPLEELVQRHALQADVYLPGFVANPYKFLKRGNVFVLSSVYEGLPNALIEAVYLRVPCVSTDCKSGPREILLDGAGGYLAPLADKARLAEAILCAIEQPERSSAQVEAAFRAVNRFHHAQASKEFEATINL